MWKLLCLFFGKFDGYTKVQSLHKYIAIQEYGEMFTLFDNITLSTTEMYHIGHGKFIVSTPHTENELVCEDRNIIKKQLPNFASVKISCSCNIRIVEFTATVVPSVNCHDKISPH